MAYFRQNLFRERLDLVEYANAFGRGRKAHLADFDPWSSCFSTSGVQATGLVTLWQWTVPKDSSRVFLITEISVVGFFGTGVGTSVTPTDLAIDQSGFFALQLNSNGQPLTPLVTAQALMNRPVSFIFQPGVLVAVVGNRDPLATGASQPVSVNLDTSVSGYFLDPEVSNRFSNMTVLQVAQSQGPGGTKVIASSGLVY